MGSRAARFAACFGIIKNPPAKPGDPILFCAIRALAARDSYQLLSESSTSFLNFGRSASGISNASAASVKDT